MTPPADRSPGGQLDMVIRSASGLSRASLAISQRLLEQGFFTPAYVWAVRSIEIFVKDFMLLPMYLEQFDGDWERARAKVREVFASGRWNLALRLINEAYGPLGAMSTDDGKDVWAEWKSKVVPRRGDMVHGVIDATPEEAALIISWALLMMDQLTLRLIASKRHPLHDLFVNAIKLAAESALSVSEQANAIKLTAESTLNVGEPIIGNRDI